MIGRLVRWALGIALVLLVLVVGGTFLRAWLLAPAAPLEAWHTVIPLEMTAEEIDRADWRQYLAAEGRAFAAVRDEVTQRLPVGARVPFNRFFEGSSVYPPRFAQDWNRSFVLAPAGAPKGAVVLLHGLTDAPYSLRHVAALYRARGWVAVGIRMPGHGTVPAGLTAATWEQWAAATRLAVREARRQVGPAAPIDIVGYSNGGALAVHYAAMAAKYTGLAPPRRLVLLSPMIGLTEFARFSGVAGWPAVIPAFAKAAWLDIIPEYNPFKYNSFPVNAARESWGLTMALQEALRTAVADGSIRRMAPVLTFQSLADSTVSTPAVVTGLYELLPANGSELVLFDINRAADLGPLLRPAVATRMATMLPPRTRKYRVTLITNAAPTTNEVVERTTPAGAAVPVERPLGLAFATQMHSMTHIAMPFPPADGLYGGTPDPAEDFGIHIGTLAARGERGVLVISLDTLLRLTFNPFYPYVAGRIDEEVAEAAE